LEALQQPTTFTPTPTPPHLISPPSDFALTPSGFALAHAILINTIYLMDDPKFFRAFLTGVARNILLGEKEITPQYLKQELFKENDTVTIEHLGAMFTVCAQLLKQAAYLNSEIPELEQAVIKATELNEMQQKTLVRYWRTQKSKVHDALRKRTKWNNSLKQFAWRIDTKTKSKDAKESISDPVAIVELSIGKDLATDDTEEQHNKDVGDVSVVRFEMDRKQIAEALVQINAIQNQIINMTA